MNQKNSVVKKLPFSFSLLVLSASSRENDDSRENYFYENKRFCLCLRASSLWYSRFLNETMFLNEYALKRSSQNAVVARARVSKQSLLR